MGSNVDACLDDLSSWESNGQLDVIRRSKCVVAVDKGLIQVKYHCFFILIG